MSNIEAPILLRDDYWHQTAEEHDYKKECNGEKHVGALVHWTQTVDSKAILDLMRK